VKRATGGSAITVEPFILAVVDRFGYQSHYNRHDLHDPCVAL
jgi:hypothetical protein